MFQERFGERAVGRGLISQNQLNETVQLQVMIRASGRRPRLGELLVKKGWIKPPDVKEILQDQLIDIQWCSGCNRHYNCTAFNSKAVYRCTACGRNLQYSFDASVITVEEDLSPAGEALADTDELDQMLGLEKPAPEPLTDPSPQPIPPEELKKMLDAESKRLRFQKNPPARRRPPRRF
jgi:hypothetical protein